MVNKERLDILLQEVIQEARALKIPVSSTIEKNVIVNGRPKKRMAGREEKLAESRHIRYIIQCKKCGRQYPRQRFTCVMQKIDAYRCQCGGKLEVFRISDS